jgi:Kef-type K+ transport system membrane component KefB
MATLGLAFLLFLAGIEIEFAKLRGQVLKLTALGFLISFGIAVGAGFVLKGAGVVQTPVWWDHPLRDVPRRDHPGAQGRR